MEKIKPELRNLIARDRVKQALEQMNGLPDIQKGDIGDDITALLTRLSALTRNTNMGILDSGEASREKNKIVVAALALIDDLGKAPSLPVPEPVLSSPIAPVSSNQKILFMASNPTNTGQLRLGEEHREVEQSLRESGMREKFALTERFAVTAKSLFTALLDESPQVVHFSGHGQMIKDNQAASGSDTGYRSLVFSLADEPEPMEGYTGGIVVEDSEGKARLVKASALATLFGNISGIKCVVLNACYSESQAKAILEKVPYVIGMNTAVPDKTAIAFASGFYRSLGNGRDYENSFALAKSLVELEGLPGAGIPVLHKNEALL
ncbi:MAG: CHAT domain-containing protein [Bacteroidia bacterium]|nr:CHAT domain-containing protein [Bacteroidia bacterium]